ncbi:MAG: flavodoxin domain-containing protein [Halanaerobiaceae bacterium]
MKTLVAFSTKYGTAEKAVEILAEYMKSEVDILDLRESPERDDLDLSFYNAVVVGGSIYAGKIQREVRGFCLENMDFLLANPLGLFICCAFGDKAEKQMEDAFTENLLEHAILKGYFGYQFNMQQMNFICRLIVRLVTGIKKTENALDEAGIKKFAHEFEAKI